MMKKLTLILLTALLSVGAWAETAVLATSTMAGNQDQTIGPAGETSTKNNVMVGKSDGIGTGWVLQCNNFGKSCNGSQKMTIDGTEYTSLKNSNGAQHTVKVPDGYVATSVTFYAVSNYTIGSNIDNDPNKGTYGTPKLSEFNGETCADEVADKGATPTAITKLLGYATSFTFTFSVTQVNYLVVVTYQEDVTKYTFGTTRDAADGQVTSNNYMLTPDCSDVTTSSLISTYNTLGVNYNFYNGTSTPLTFGTNATESYRNLANSTTIKTQNGELDGAENHGAYVAFDLTIAQNKRLNILSIASAVYPGEKSNYGFEYIVEDADGNQLYKSPSALNISNPQAANDYLDYSANVGAVSALRNLSGKVRVKFLWWCNSTSTVLILKDFNVTATLDEVSETGKEYALKEVKINDVTYDYATSGNTVSEPYASLPSVKFIYSVKKVWSDGVKTDAEDEEEVVTPTLVGGNQVATTTKLAEAFTLTFTNVAQFPVVPNAVGSYIDLTSAVLTNCHLDSKDKNIIASTHNGSTMTIDLKNNTAGDYILQFLSGAQNLTATVNINVKGSGYDETQSFNIANTGAWTPSELHAMELKNLPAGNLTLKLTVTSTSTTGSYAGNYGSFAIRGAEDYIDLATGTYSGAKTIDNPTSQGGKKVGYCSNNSSATYHFYALENGNYNLCMAMSYNAGGSMNVRISDATGTEELNQDIAITSDLCKGYGVEVPMALSSALTSGLKTIQLTFTTSGSYLMDYENVRITRILPTITLIDAVLNGGSNAPTVTGTYAGSAVAKTQATADATVGGYKFDGGCYVGLTLATGYTFKAGDVLHVNVTKANSGGSSLALYKSATDSDDEKICVTNIKQETGDLTFTLTEAFNGLSTFYLYRSTAHAWNGYVASVNVVGVERERVEQTYSVNYSLGESGALGTVPAAIADENILTKYAAPVNQTLYKEGYTLKGWTDGENEYLIGQSYDMAEGEHNLTPVFAANTETFALVKSDIEVTWYFGKNNGAPTYTGAAEVQTKQANLNGETIDLAVLMAGGDNSGRNDEWMNNQQKNMTVPVCAGAVVTAKVYYINNNAVFNGETITYDAEQHGEQGNVVFTYTCPETVGSTIDVNVGNQFLSYIKVTYPAHATISDEMTTEAMTALNGFNGAVTINRSLTAGMYNTICLPFAMTAAEISEKLGTCDIRELSTATLNDNVLVLDFTVATAIEAGKAYLIKPAAAVSSWTMENVTLSKTTTPTIGASADFIGVLTPTQLTASENTLCVGAYSTLFYVGETNTMKGLRAYFTVKGAAAGAPARISLGSHVVTDLENVDVNAKANKLIEQGRVIIRIEGHDYDLNGHLLK